MPDDVRTYLKEGWAVAGYSTTIMAMGAMTHSVLLRKDDRMVTVTVVVNAGREVGRNAVMIA